MVRLIGVLLLVYSMGLAGEPEDRTSKKPSVNDEDVTSVGEGQLTFRVMSSQTKDSHNYGLAYPKTISALPGYTLLLVRTRTLSSNGVERLRLVRRMSSGN